MELTKPKAILFDWDNTLVNTWPIIHQALHNTFLAIGQEPWDLETVKRRVARSMRDSFPQIFGEKWEEVGEIYQQEFRNMHLDRLEALPEAGLTLEFLAGKPVCLAVVSNKRGENLRKESTHISWDKYFSKIIGATDTPNDKPAPDPVYAALEGSGLAAGNEVWFIGDSVVDMECAHRAGCTPIFFGELPDEPLEYGYAAHVEHHGALMQLLKKML